MNQLPADINYALRQWHRSPGFAFMGDSRAGQIDAIDAGAA
jgi:hypothetical protein